MMKKLLSTQQQLKQNKGLIVLKSVHLKKRKDGREQIRLNLYYQKYKRNLGVKNLRQKISCISWHFFVEGILRKRVNFVQIPVFKRSKVGKLDTCDC